MLVSARCFKIICFLLFFLFSVPTLFAWQRTQLPVRASSRTLADFDVFLPIQNRIELEQLLNEQQDPSSTQYHKWLTPAQFAKRFGPSQVNVDRIRQVLQASGMTVLSEHSHGLRVRGSVTSIERLFSTTLLNSQTGRGTSRLVASGRLNLPLVMTQAGAQIPAFSTAVRARLHTSRVAVSAEDSSASEPQNRTSAKGGYWFTDLKQAYDFPSYESLTGHGTTIGVLMSSDYRLADMTGYFSHEGVTPPTVTRRPVLGGAVYDPKNNDGTVEAALDLQQAGGMAPGASLVLYNIPDLGDRSILYGYLAVVTDNVADIVTMSFGGPERLWSSEYNGGQDDTAILSIADDIFKQGNAQGITFVASSGDYGGLNTPPLAYFTNTPVEPPRNAGAALAGVEFPASSPHVTGVGGTNLVTTYSPGSKDSIYVRENANGDPLIDYDPYGVGNLISGAYWGSGGGRSNLFIKPAYQLLVDTGSRFRTVPDIALHMGGCPSAVAIAPCGPDRSYAVATVSGQSYGVIGTSASAPAMAGLLALRAELTGGRLGNANFYIYTKAASQAAGVGLPAFIQNIPGFNGARYTRDGYNLVLGNGTVDAKVFIGADDMPSAGTPGSASNP